ncbi:MAG TPA: glycogen/starch synthase [Candidatus Omnitrophota bacterium]|nr:glycogen/starch synthase [Candidatus Omnitrophota bacterium]
MKIAFIMSEAVPYAKTGGLADVCGALPLELENLGAEVVMFLPRYQSVRASGVILHSLNNDVDFTSIGQHIKVYFIKHDMYLREGLYGDRFGDYQDNLKRFSYFCVKSLETLKRTNFIPDVIHCHDWQASLVPMYAKIAGKNYFGLSKSPKTLLTIHNISYQGIFPKEQINDTGLGWEQFTVSGFEFYDKINLLKGGIEYADYINTVSPTHAQEILTKEFGCGLDGVLKSRQDRFCGIVNGMDYKVWNPQGDPDIFKNYSAERHDDKKANKIKLQEFCKLSKGESIPLCGFVGRLVDQKGIDLVINVIPKLVENGFQLIILGKGEPKYEDMLIDIAKNNPASVFFSSQFDDELAHKIYAASDLFFMPSRFEPCGMGQLISFKYGTIPVVFKTGGLSDTVEDYHKGKNSGTGLVFSRFEPEDFLAAVLRSKDILSEAKKHKEMITRIMKLNFSWKESAKKYMDIFHKMTAGK